MKTAALYVRVSTQEQKQHGLSVDSQIKALQDYCKQNKLKIHKIYNDAGISARKKYTRRPALLELMEDCKQGKIDIILFTKLDRWFRSVADYYEVQQILDQTAVPWRAIWEDYETETSTGQFKVNIMLSVAQAEADRTSERIKAVNQYKKEKGGYVGSAPTGYKVVGSDLLIDETKKDGMSALFKEYLTSFSMKKALLAAEKYGVTFNIPHIYRLIRSPAYHGDAYGYKCEPYITKEEHDLILSTFKTKVRAPKRSDRVYLFSGLVICGYCNHRMSAKGTNRTHADGQIVTYNLYVCQYQKGTRCKHPYLQIYESVIEAYLLSELDNILSDFRISVSLQAKSVDRVKTLRQKSNLESKLKRLQELYVDGDISKEDYSVKKENLQQQIDNLILEPLPEPKELPDNWKDIYNDLDPEHRQAFWKSIIEKIIVTNETKTAPEVVFRL